MTLADSASCERRAQEHRDAGLELMSAESELGREWAAVCFFYSAYHRVRAALLTDPVFSDAQRLSTINVHLQMADRNASHHQGRRGTGHALGVSELVPLLYPSIRTDYGALYTASITVRYGVRLIAPLEDLKERCGRINDAADRGALVA